MASLYELTADYMSLLDMAEDPDVDPEAFKDTLEGLEGELEDKAENYAKVMRMIAGDISACEAEERRLRAKRQTMENNVKRMKQALQYAMEATSKTKFKTALFSFTVAKNPESVIVDEQHIENIPERFLTIKQPEVNKAAIKKAIKDGEDLTGLAHLEQTTSLRIR